MASGGLSGTPLGQQNAFNWVFLVELLVCSILTVFFLFYFNRLFATLVSYGIRAISWHRYRAYIDIQAIQISLLGGRIFFKNVRYHGHNETILVQSGYITWKYWLGKVKKAEVFSRQDSRKEAPKSSDGASAKENRKDSTVDREEGGAKAIKDLPCRISIKVSGFEAFLYNRSPGYDYVVDNITRLQTSRGERQGDAPLDPEVRAAYDPPQDDSASGEGSNGTKRSNHTNAHVRTSDKPSLPAFLRIFPIRVDCRKAAVVVGNENTKAILVAKVDRASGEFDAGGAGPLDVYKQIFRFECLHPTVNMLPNSDYKSPQLAMAARLNKEARDGVTSSESFRNSNKRYRLKRRWWHPLKQLQNIFKKSSSSSILNASFDSSGIQQSPNGQPSFPGQERWQGLSRYLDESQYDEHDEWDAVEYAKSSLLVDIPKVSLTFYWDVPGPVPLRTGIEHVEDKDTDDVNGTTPPEYGLDLHVHGGTINYGPWADRLRINFQSIFFPGSYCDAQVASKLQPGDARVNTIFKIFICIDEDTTLRIPMREASKDWKWKGKAQAMAGQGKDVKERIQSKGRRRTVWRKREKRTTIPSVRPFGWLDVKVLANSTVNYTMDMVAQHNGYQNKLDLDIRGSEISSSVNHGLLWRCGALSLNCDLSFPLAWNTLRTWRFNVICNDMDLFILRDHLFLITDLVTDWGSGPPSDYFVFIPFRYLLKVELRNFKLYLNTNDSNIINNPAEINDNNFLTLFGRSLVGDVVIPLDRFRPLQNEIFFNMLGRDFGLELLTPPRSTTKTFLKNNIVAQLDEVTLKGSHNYFTQSSATLTDTLSMDIHGSRLSLYVYGFLLKHLIRIKENYFGEDLHFKTLEEFQGLTNRNSIAEDRKSAASPTNRSNDLDVILCLGADNVTVLLPANIYNAEDNIAIDVPFANVDLRFTNYYMDLMLNSSPLSISKGSKVIEKGVPVSNSGRVEMFIDGANAYGHRLFGLPPAEPTYVGHWDVDVGSITGECSSSFLDRLVNSVIGLAFGVDDDENALAHVESVVVPDISFLRLRTGLIKIWAHIASDALLIQTAPVSVDFNDWASESFSQRLQVCVPEVIIACVDAEAASRHRTKAFERESIETHAYFQTAVALGLLRRKLHFTEERQQQQKHLWEHDQRTRRTPFLMLPGTESGLFTVQDPPAMIVPPQPYPLKPNDRDNSSRSWTASSRSSVRSTVRHGASIAHSLASTRSIDDFQSVPDREWKEPSASTHSPASKLSTAAISKEDERTIRGLPPSSVAFSSPLAAPYFPLALIQPDSAEAPRLPAETDDRIVSAESSLEPNEEIFQTLDEGSSHTSLILDMKSGIKCFFKPQAVFVALRIMEAIQPKCPEDFLDGFQTKVIGEILGDQKREVGIGESLEVSLRIPVILLRFINIFTSSRDGDTMLEKDLYDLSLRQLTMNLRNKQLPQLDQFKDSISAHCTLKSVDIHVREQGLYTSHDDVAARAHFDDILLWLSKTDRASIHIAYRDFEAAAASRRMEYLAALVYRTTRLVEELQTRFEVTERIQKQKLQLLAYELTMAGENISDPVFLSRPSYALRAATDHLRTHDSWKIISRFRYILQSLSAESRSELAEKIAILPTEPSTDDQATVLRKWDEWRTWDLSHVKRSLAMRRLYGNAISCDDVSKSAFPPVELSLRAGSTRLLVDPGPKQSGVNMSVLILNLSANPPASPSGLMLVKEVSAQEITIQANVADISFHVNWEICALVESCIELFLSENPHSGEDNQPNPPTKHNKPSTISLHTVIAVDAGSIAVETINVKVKNSVSGLKASVIGNVKAEKGKEMYVSANAFLHADLAMFEISSKYRTLVRAQTVEPNLFISKDTIQVENKQTDSWNITGQANEILVDLKEEPPGFLEFADSVLMDEVMYFKTLSGKFPKRKESAPKAPKDVTKPVQSVFPRLHLALFMNYYRIDVALFHSLIYTLSGRTGRMSAVPTIGQGTTFKLDFDLAQQTNVMRTITQMGSQDIATLKFPPVNGFVNVKQSAGGQTFIDLVTLVEVISFDGASMYGLAAALNRPEVFEAINAMQADVKTMQTHIEEIFPSTPKTPKTSRSPRSPTSLDEIAVTSNLPLLFNVDVTLAGLKITAATPSNEPNDSAAELTLVLSSLKLTASNVAEDKSTMLQFPELNADLPELSIFLTLLANGKRQECGNITLGLKAIGTTQDFGTNSTKREYRIVSSALEVNLFAETASAAVDVLNHLQDRIKDIDFSKERQYLRRLRNKRRHPSLPVLVRTVSGTPSEGGGSVLSNGLFTSAFSFELLNIQISWIVGNSVQACSNRANEDLVLSFKSIGLSSKSEDGARLAIEDMQLQMTPPKATKWERTANSALLPEIVFNVGYASTADSRQLAFQAAGKSLEVLLEPQFILPADAIERSITLAVKKFRNASAGWQIPSTEVQKYKKNPFSSKHLASLVVDAKFAGAVVRLQARSNPTNKRESMSPMASDRLQHEGRFGQFGDSSSTSTTLRSPGVSVKVDYQDTDADSSLNIEVKVDASSNTVYPSVVPLLMEISETVQTVVKAKDKETPVSPTKSVTKKTEDDSIIIADPSTLLGKTKLNIGLRICTQEFSLSCQPIARVAATAKFEDIYLTVNSVRSQDHGNFLALSGTFEKLEVAVQHVYSRDSTFSFDVDAVKLSILNSKHLSGTSGVSAILKIDPMRTQINARQLQDFLLFREIWIPAEVRQPTAPVTDHDLSASQDYLVQRYQQVTAAAVFPWNATIAIEKMSVDLDLGQAIGKSSLTISELWVSSKKDSDWEQNLCVGIKSVAINSTGRMSGFINLKGIKVRTSIAWPAKQEKTKETPLVQASIGFDALQVKAVFDYQPFAIADITNFEFIMYNVREPSDGGRDRLVAILDGDKVQAFCIATSAARGLALFQSFERLVQENQAAYKQSLKDIEKYLRRQSTTGTVRTVTQPRLPSHAPSDVELNAPISLHTDVVVTLRSISLGAFPGTFLDAQVFTVEASDVQARFAVMLDDARIHSALGMTLGQLSVAVGSVSHAKTIDKPGEVTAEEVINSARFARGGTILRVPKVVATMRTWQQPNTNHIDYIFKSSFEGKVDVGWNYSRISFIRSMWDSHSRTLASRLGKPLPASAVKITAKPSASTDSTETQEGEKITAVVNVPQSKYDYTALEPPIIDTPQLRDMGEATPPLEWIGLHRDRLPNVTHQIVIVMLLEVAKEVEDAYSRILGSS